MIMERLGACLIDYILPFFITGKFVIMDSVFGVLLFVIALKKMVLFSAALIKKRRYWPRYVKAEDIKAHF